MKLTHATTLLTGLLAGLIFWAHPALGAPPSGAASSLKKVQVRTLEQELVIDFEFEKRPQVNPPRFFNRSIEFDVPSATLGAGQKYFSSPDAEVTRIYASQLEAGGVRIRLLLAPEAAGVKERLRWSLTGRLLKVRVEKFGDPLGSLLARARKIQNQQGQKDAPAKGPASPPVTREAVSAAEPGDPPETAAPSTAPVLLSEVVARGLAPGPAPTAEPPDLKNATELLAGEGSGPAPPDLWSSGLRMLYALVVVLGVLMVLFYLFKKHVWKQGTFGGDSKPVRVLSTGFLGPRKNIALVEIPGEVLVLGVANDHISLLANIRDPAQIARIKGQEAPPSVPVNGNAKAGGEPAPKAEAASPKPSSKKEGVDLYRSRVKTTARSNPFLDYVQQFSDDSSETPRTVQDVTSQIRENLQRIQAR